MKDALDVVMAWQLRNPTNTDPAEAIAAVKKAREGDGELPQRLASHFLKLTIPPFFPQNKSSDTFDLSKKPAPWKDSHNEYVLDLLRWSIQALDAKAIEQNWHLLVPPILKMLDETEAEHKARGCQYLAQLLQILDREPHKNKSAAFLARTGYHEVFASTLWPLFTYIPSLTPESDSVPIFQSVYLPLSSLANLSKSDAEQTRFKDKLMREGVLAPLSHFPTPSTYPDLACIIIHQITEITKRMGIESVKHLPSLVPLLTSIMQDPFILGHKHLALATVRGLQSLMQTCWPRLPAHRGAITLGLCVLKGRCEEESNNLPEGEESSQKRHDLLLVQDIIKEVKDTAEMLDAVLSQSEVNEEWQSEKMTLVDVDEGLKGFFEVNVVPSSRKDV